MASLYTNPITPRSRHGIILSIILGQARTISINEHMSLSDIIPRWPRIIDSMSPVCKPMPWNRWTLFHSIESPSMVDPQGDIWHWGSKWNLHTVCWSAVDCEWGTTSVYFGITYVCFVPSRLPVFAVEPQYLLQDFFCQKYHLKDTYKIFKKIHVGLKFEWGL